MSLSLSVVVPLYNHEAYIGSTLMSVFAQTRRAREVIVIDDGSQDAGLEIVRGLQRNRPELICWGHPNRGAHNTINLGIARSTSDLVAILNSDDLYESARFDRVARAFEADPELDAVVTNMSFIDSDGGPTPFPWFDEAMGFYRDCKDFGLAMVNGNFVVTTSNLVVRREVFDRIGLFANLRYAHDLDFLLRLSVEGCKIQLIDEPLLRYRIHPTNTIAEGVLKVKAEWAAVTAFYLSRLVQKDDGVDRLAKYIPILRKHALSEPVLMLMSYFSKWPSETFERTRYHLDEGVKRRVLETIT